MAKVKYAKLNRMMFIPGIGEVPLTLPPQNKSWKLSMETQDNGLLLNITLNNQLIQGVIPYSNLDGFVLVSEEKAAAVKAA